MRTRRRVRHWPWIIASAVLGVLVAWFLRSEHVDDRMRSVLTALIRLALLGAAYTWARRHLGRARSPGQAARRAVALRLLHSGALFAAIVVMLGPVVHLATPAALAAGSWLLLVPAGLAIWAGVTALVERGVTRAFVVSSAGAVVAIAAMIPALHRSSAGHPDGWLAPLYVTGIVVALAGFAVGLARSSLLEA